MAMGLQRRECAMQSPNPGQRRRCGRRPRRSQELTHLTRTTTSHFRLWNYQMAPKRLASRWSGAVTFTDCGTSTDCGQLGTSAMMRR